jgi:uncharacterized lipoprotein YmbA
VSTRRLPALLIVLALGCGGLFPKSARSDFFLLTALEPAATAGPAAATPSVLLAPVVVPEYLDRPELVTRLASNQLRVEDLELWAEPLRVSVPRTMEQNLATLLGSGRVRQSPWSGPAPPDLVVSVDVHRFEKTSAGKVELAAHWTITDGRGETEPLRRETHLSYATAAGTQAAVAAMSEALAALSRAIAWDVQKIAQGQASASPPPTPPGGGASGPAGGWPPR